MKLQLALVAVVFSASTTLAQTTLSPPTTPATTEAAATRPAFTLGKETTRIVAPLLADGRPDYVGALDQARSKGVTPENNVLVGLLEVLGTGPEMISQKIHDEYLKRLGITQEQKTTFKNFQAYLKEEGIEYSDGLQVQEDQAHKGRWNSKEFPEIAAWLAKYDQALDQVVKAAGRERYYSPLIATSERAQLIGVLLPSLGGIRGAANALTARAMLRLDGGQIKGCQADLIAAHRLGRLVMQGPTLIEKLVGMSIEGIAARGDITLAEGLGPDAAKNYLAELGKLPTVEEVNTSVDELERFSALDAVLAVSKFGAPSLVDSDGVAIAGDWGDTSQVDWDKVLKRMNGWYDRMVSAMRMPTFAERQTKMVALEKEIEEIKAAGVKASGLTATDPTERTTVALMSILLPSVGKARVLADRAREWTDLGTLAVALAAYRGEKGAYPEKLEALAPGYLKEVPKDIFADAPLKYRKDGEGYVLYSVGPSLKDDGRGAKDIVVRMSK